jgi:hypothetical protein
MGFPRIHKRKMKVIVARSNCTVPFGENLAISSTDNYHGFTPLRMLMRHCYGHDADKDVETAISQNPASGVTVLGHLSPKLFIVEKTKDIQRLKELAHALVQAADDNQVQHLLVCSFDSCFKLNPAIMEAVFDGFLNFCDGKAMQRITVPLSNEDNYHKARAVLSRVRYDTVIKKYKREEMV